MPVRTRLPQGVVKALNDAEGGLRTFVEGERAAFEEMSERWQDGDRAADVSVWLDSLDELVEALVNWEPSAF